MVLFAWSVFCSPHEQEVPMGSAEGSRPDEKELRHAGAWGDQASFRIAAVLGVIAGIIVPAIVRLAMRRALKTAPGTVRAGGVTVLTYAVL
jgi:hypothetical protein